MAWTRAVVLLSVISCSGSAAPATAPVAIAPAKPAQAQPSAPDVVRHVVITQRWVEPYVPTDPAQLRAWSADPENASALLPDALHILIRAPEGKAVESAAAKKQAEAALARIKSGEDFGLVAREVSQDPGSSKRGGAYGGDQVVHFVQPFRDAYDALAPGQVYPKPVLSTFGWHIIKKGVVDDASLAIAYKHAHAEAVTRALVDTIRAQWRHDAVPKQAVDGAIRATLGAAAAADPKRPSPIRLDAKAYGCAATARSALDTPGTPVVRDNQAGAFVIAMASPGRADDDAPRCLPDPDDDEEMAEEQKRIVKELLKKLQESGAP